nr:two-component sensor kinase SA14-24 [uncultured bacterium]
MGDILNVSHIETGRKFSITPKPMDVAPLLRDTVQETASMASKKGVRIATDNIPERFMRMADADKIKEVFANLISNAIKYTPVGGTVDVSVIRIGDEDAIVVRDEGIGIPKKEQPRIFERLYRATNVEGSIEGTGLGLYIAKVIVERHGGRIWFDSEEGRGTTFHVTLPPSA